MKLSAHCLQGTPLWLALAFCFSLLTHGSADAQQFIVRQPGGKNRNTVLYKQFMQQLEQTERIATHRIGCRLDDIKVACELTDAQQKKLSIACKGAVKSYMKNATQKIKTTAQQSGFDFEPGNPPKEVKADEDKANAAFAQNIMVVNGVAGGRGGEALVENEKIWKMTVKKVLTEDQNNKLQTWEEQRRLYLRQVAVDNFVARVDMKLLLSPDQRQRLTEWVDEKHGRQLAAKYKKSQIPQPQFIRFGGIPTEASVKKIQGPVAEILSESQREVWAANFRQELDQLGPLQPAIQAIPAIPLAPAVRIQVDEIDN